jgi:hypothetical protein
MTSLDFSSKVMVLGNPAALRANDEEIVLDAEHPVSRASGSARAGLPRSREPGSR